MGSVYGEFRTASRGPGIRRDDKATRGNLMSLSRDFAVSGDGTKRMEPRLHSRQPKRLIIDIIVEVFKLQGEGHRFEDQF
jgi:hypothetical protein